MTDWLADLCGAAEPELAGLLKYDLETGQLTTPSGKFQAGKFSTPTAGRLLYDAYKKMEKLIADSQSNPHFLPRPMRPNVTIVTGEDAGQAIVDAPVGTIFQVDSHLNCLEIPLPDITPQHGVKNYILDRTPGPRAVLACAPGLLVRNYCYPNTDLLEDIDLDFSEELGLDYKNGYLLWGDHPEPVLASLTEKAEQIRIGVMRDTTVAGITFKDGEWNAHQQDKTITQLFTSAVPVQCYGNKGNYQVQLAIAKLLIKTQYMAVISYAIQHTPTPDTPVHLTLLGAGAFGVPLYVVVDQLYKVLIQFPYPLEVVVHCYRDSDKELLRGLEWSKWRIVLQEEEGVEYPLRPHQLILLRKLIQLQHSIAVDEEGILAYHSESKQLTAKLHVEGSNLWYTNQYGQVRTLLYKG